MKRISTTETPEIKTKIEEVAELSDDARLIVASIEAGLFSHTAYITVPSESFSMQEVEKGILSGKLPPEAFYGQDIDKICETIVVRSGIWGDSLEVTSESLAFLEASMGAESVSRHEEEFGEAFKFLAAKKIVELRGWAFSPVWYSVGVLIFKNYYKDPFKAGAFWALLEQKIFRERSFVDAKKEATSVDLGRKQGTKKGRQKAKLRKEFMLQWVLEMLGDDWSFSMASNLEQAKKLKVVALQRQAELFTWGGAPQKIEYFSRFLEDNNLEIRRRMQAKKD